jgi:transposase
MTRCVRWARRGIWENLFRGFARNGRSTETQNSDSTQVKAQRSAGGKGGLLAACVEGATKLHALADAKQRLVAILLPGGEANECPVAGRPNPLRGASRVHAR